ncbi:flocculation protein FLO11-like [Pecten maximus]|uniref:flocculation protein FLO11-like n=1 Tax=Pecten maximus TaxID=6579 RepID=UPI001458FFE6|nr:flocculation protein FLO11-like [Pecten maximus]
MISKKEILTSLKRIHKPIPNHRKNRKSDCIASLRGFYSTRGRRNTARTALFVIGEEDHWSKDDTRLLKVETEMERISLLIVGVGIQSFSVLNAIQMIVSDNRKFYVLPSYSGLKRLSEELTTGPCLPMSLETSGSVTPQPVTPVPLPTLSFYKRCRELADGQNYIREIPFLGWQHLTCPKGTRIDTRDCKCRIPTGDRIPEVTSIVTTQVLAESLKTQVSVPTSPMLTTRTANLFVTTVETTTLKSPPVQTTTPKSLPVQITTPKSPPVQITTQKSPPVQTTTQKSPPVHTTTQKSTPGLTTTQKSPPVQTTTPKSPPVQTTPKSPPVQTTTPKSPPVQTTTPKSPPAPTTTPKSTPVQTTTPKSPPVQTTTPKSPPVQTTIPASIVKEVTKAHLLLTKLENIVTVDRNSRQKAPQAITTVNIQPILHATTKAKTSERTTKVTGLPEPSTFNLAIAATSTSDKVIDLIDLSKYLTKEPSIITTKSPSIDSSHIRNQPAKTLNFHSEIHKLSASSKWTRGGGHKT